MEQVLTMGTAGSWLTCLSAITFVNASNGDCAKLISLCPLAVAIIDLPAQQVVAMSPKMSQVLDAGGRRAPVDLDVLEVEPAGIATLFDLVVNGTIDVYGAHRTLRRGSDHFFEAEVWMAVSTVPDRHLALWIISPGEGDDASDVSLPSLEQWPREVPGLIVGVFGADWCFETVCDAAAELTGRRVEEIVGRPLTDFVHDDDVESLFIAVARTFVEESGVGVRLRLCRGDGSWRGGHAIVTRIMDPELRFGLAFSLSENVEPEADRRVAALERHLWRIAREIDDAGVGAGSSPVPSLDALSGISDLSARQEDVLNRLLRGERTATIAHDMFISPSTVRNHLSDIFKKMGVHSQGELLEHLRADELRDERRV